MPFARAVDFSHNPEFTLLEGLSSTPPTTLEWIDGCRELIRTPRRQQGAHRKGVPTAYHHLGTGVDIWDMAGADGA